MRAANERDPLDDGDDRHTAPPAMELMSQRVDMCPSGPVAVIVPEHPVARAGGAHQ